MRFLPRSFSIFDQKREVYNSALRENILVNVARNKVFKTREKLTVDRFIEKSKKRHGDKFNYSLVKSINGAKNKVVIVCNSCGGPFIQTPDRHMSGDGCYYCSGKYQRNTLSFIKDAIQIHGFEFDYSESSYIDTHTKIKIKHKCGYSFEVKPNNHIWSKSGCPKCKGGVSYSQDEFIKKCVSVHGDKYNYDKVNYKNTLSKIKIYCKCCNNYFTQCANAHSCGSGCPACCESKGEREIARFLTKNKIEFIRQFGPEGCINIKQLYFDFYLPNIKTVIEFNGEQHYRAINHFGGVKNFKNTIKRDQIKSKWCDANNIKLYIIKYNDDLILQLENLINGDK